MRSQSWGVSPWEQAHRPTCDLYLFIYINIVIQYTSTYIYILLNIILYYYFRYINTNIHKYIHCTRGPLCPFLASNHVLVDAFPAQAGVCPEAARDHIHARGMLRLQSPPWLLAQGISAVHQWPRPDPAPHSQCQPEQSPPAPASSGKKALKAQRGREGRRKNS